MKPAGLSGFADDRITDFRLFDIVPRGRDFEAVYRLAEQSELSALDWMTIRDILELGGISEDPAMVSLLILMFETLQEGSLCLELDKAFLTGRFDRRIETGVAQALADVFFSRLRAGRYHRIIATDPARYAPLIAVTAGSVQALYFQKYFFHENRLRVRIRKLLESPGEPVETEALNALMDEIFSLPLTLRTAPGGNPISRDIHQVEAIMLALTRQLSIISGGPGTGKTSLMVNILRCLWRLGVQPSNTVVCAPTGRAAQRMTEALHKNLQTILNPGPADHALSSIFADTIHRALKFRTVSNDFTYGVFNPLPADVVIVDEVSMVDVVLMEKLMSAIDPETTRVILLGDKDQLPSVEAGAVLAQIVPESADEKTVSGHLAILKTVFRSDRHIQDLADAVNRGEIPQHVPQNSLADAQDHSPHPWRVIGFSSVNRLNQDLMDWLSRRFLQPFDILEEPEASKRPGSFKTGELPGTNPAFADLIALAGSLPGEQLTDVSKGHDILERLFHVVESSRILTLVRKGPTGCEAINRLASRFLGGRFQKSSRITDGAFSGAVIMVTRNDYSRSLFNGDIGLVIRGRQGGDRAYFRRGDGFISFPSDTLPAWESAFATTVHKSQGSEFDEVLVVLPREPTHRILSREIIYTAITRAKKRVFIYGDPEVLRTAVRRKIVRRSGMDW